MTAHDFASFRSAAADFEVPSQNLVYADTAGNIAYQAPGRIPVRSGHDGTVPVPGWTDAARWERFLAFDELPYTLNPASGMIVTANQLVLPPGSTPFLHVDVSAGQRGGRIVELLGDRDDLTLDDLAAVQLDNHNTNAATLVPYLLAVPSDDAAVLAVQSCSPAGTCRTTWTPRRPPRSTRRGGRCSPGPSTTSSPSGRGRPGAAAGGRSSADCSTNRRVRVVARRVLTERQTRDDVLLLAMADAHAELVRAARRGSDATGAGVRSTR
jgi:hypothetical protein